MRCQGWYCTDKWYFFVGFFFLFFLRAHVGKVNISLKGLQFENLSEHLLPLEELGERKFSK